LEGDEIGIGQDNMQRFFYPRGVAVVGSTSKGKLGYELIRQMLDGGYRDIFAVNPRAQGVFSVPGYDAVGEIEHPLDLAVVVSPAPTVPAVLEDCGRAGVKAALILTAGFSEVGNHAGEAEIKRVAGQYGIRFFGPNCAGILNTGNSFFPTLESRPPAGGVSVIAQSGAVGGVILAWAKEFGLGVSKFVSYGNGADLKEIDLLEYLAGDPETKVVALYSESVTNGREFMQVVRECTTQKPLVVIKSGRTRSGQRAALSHTGSMAGTDAVYDAALRQCGAIRVHSIEEMFDLCKGFLYVPPVAGRRVAIVTNSGGPGVMAADRAEEVGLEVAEPSRATQERLREFLPAHCALRNPVDLTVEGTEAGYRKTLLAVLQENDAALALNVATPYLDSVPLAQGICDAAQQSGKPIVTSFLPRAIVADAIPHLQERGVPNFATGERGVAVLARMAEYEAQKSEKPSLPIPWLPQDEKELPGTGQMLEPEAMTWLRENGIPVPDFRFAKTSDEAKQGCREIGYPVVMKVVSPDILHKSDYGGVILDIQDDRAALAAFASLERAAIGKRFSGVIIYPMIKDALEVLLGLSRDPQFGPVVAFGLGGIYTEIWRDVSLRVAPIDLAEAQTMIRGIKAFPLLEGVRGQEPRDLDALVDVLVRVSQLPFHYPELDELDLNPVFLLPQGLVVGDVRVIRQTYREEQ
jgi:acetyltransferase